MSMETGDIVFNQQFKLHHGLKEKNFVYDFNIYEVFTSINHTKTIMGRQYLYHSLCTPKLSISQINELESEISYFKSDELLRKSFDIAASKVKDDNAYRLPELFFGKKYIAPEYFAYVNFLVCIEFLVFILGFFYVPLFALLLVLMCVNTSIHLINKNRLFFFRRTFRPIGALVEASKAIKDSKHVFITADQSLDNLIEGESFYMAEAKKHPAVDQ